MLRDNTWLNPNISRSVINRGYIDIKITDNTEISHIKEFFPGYWNAIVSFMVLTKIDMISCLFQ